jgi:hypothetical protein
MLLPPEKCAHSFRGNKKAQKNQKPVSWDMWIKVNGLASREVCAQLSQQQKGTKEPETSKFVHVVN